MVIPQLNYFTILKWIGAAAAIVAVIGVPVWYINNKIDSAFERGKAVGMAECENRHTELVLEVQAEANKTQSEESTKAQVLEGKLRGKQIEVTKLQAKLNEELAKGPIGCVINRDATSLLRAAAGGDFSLSGAPIPGQLNPKVPGGSSVPGEGGITSSGHGTGVRSSN